MKPTKQPSKYLYLGIGIDQLEEITKNGLAEVDGKKIYLFENKEDAFQAGKKEGIPTTVLSLDALKMHDEGYIFYFDENTWTTQKLPSQYLSRLSVGKGERFTQGDVYIEDPFEEVMFRYDAKSDKIYRKFYAEKESKKPVPHDNRLYYDTLMTGFEITKDEYLKGKKRDEL